MKELERLLRELRREATIYYETNNMEELSKALIAYNQIEQAILKMFEEKEQEIRRTKEALNNQMQCVGELKEFLHSAKHRIAELEGQIERMAEMLILD